MGNRPGRLMDIAAGVRTRRRARRPMARIRTLAKRAFLTMLGVQAALAVSLTLVDAYRRRGKKPAAFPTTDPVRVPIGDGTVTTYTFGQDLYDDMLAAIDGARHQVLLESYIWKGDELGQRFKDALTAAVDRGVEVCVIYDAFANLVVPRRFKQFDPRINVQAYPVYGAGWRFFDLRRYGRDHRKILVVDDSVGYVGGYNIGAVYATQWRDTHVKVTGAGAAELGLAFAQFWNRNLQRLSIRGVPPLAETTDMDWEPRIRAHRNLPRYWMFPIRAMYLDAINRSSRTIYMTQAYFIPDAAFAEAMMAAARRGVDVRLLVPAVSNHVVADWLSRGYYSELLAAGVRIFRFQDAMVHAKTATIDGRWSTVGTANIDRLSMTGNYEINLEIIDDAMAAEMERVFLSDLTNCVELTASTWQARGLHRKFTEMVLAPLRPLL